MSLTTIVEDVAARERTLVCRAPADAAGLVEEVGEYLGAHNVAVVHEVPADGTERAVLHGPDGERVLAEVPLDALRALVDPGVVRRVGEPVPYRPLLTALSEVTFTSYDRRQMLTASREIEDRAWRRGEGTLRAGFQRLSVFVEEREVYDRLGDSALDIHVYGEPDVEPPAGPYTVHGTTEADVDRSWFVAYDGGGRPDQACALLAEERAAGFYGFWTYDPDLVDTIVGTLPGTQATVPDR